MENQAIAIIEPAEIEARRRGIEEEFYSYLAGEVEAGQMAADTAASYRRGLRKFVGWGAADPDRATDHAIKQWLADLRAGGASPNAIAAWFAGVRAFFQWACAEGRIAADPTQGVKRGRRAGTAKAHKRELLTDDEMCRILESELSPRDRALVYLLAYTGARGIELHRANVEDLHTEGGELVLHVQGKGRDEADERVIIAHPAARAALYDYLAARGTDRGPLLASESNRSEGERLSRRALRAIVRGILDRAGIVSRSKTVHSFRHSAITNAIRNGASLLDTQAMARHASPNTTMIYYHALNRIENAAEKRIDYRRPAA